MRIGWQGATLAATLRPRLRLGIAWVVGGAAALFIANVISDWAMLVVVPLLGCLWFALAIDGLVQGWRSRAVGLAALLPAVLPFVALPFAAWTASQALYWSHVAPSWWLLRGERPAFAAAVTGGRVPRNVVHVERVGTRVAFGTHGAALGAFWSGIVYDPTNRMVAARGWNGGPVASDVRHIFNGNTIWCQRLDSHWFHCQFG